MTQQTTPQAPTAIELLTALLTTDHTVEALTATLDKHRRRTEETARAILDRDDKGSDA